MSDNGKKLIRNSTAEFLIFTRQAGEQSIEARRDEVEPLLSAVTRRRRK
jgi:hypothetical protein